MLMSLRQSVNKSFIKYLIFGILILSFGLWGVADLFIPSSGANETVMTAGERSFTYAEVERSYRLELRNLEINPDTTSKDILERVQNNVLQRLAVSAMNSQLIKSLGLQGDRQSVLANIAENQAFRNVFANFDSDLFQRFLSISGLNEAEYTSLVAQDIGAQHLLASLQTSVTVPESLAKAYGDHLRQVREIEYIEIPYDSISVDEPNDSELLSYYNENKENYETDEERSFSYVVISPSSLAAEITPSEEEVRTRYDAGGYGIQQPEKRDISFVIFTDAEAAVAALEATSVGEALEAVAKENNLQVQKLLSQSKDSIADVAIAEAAFAITDVGYVSDIVEGAFGYVLVRVDGITEAQTLSFEAAKDNIVADILAERTDDVIYEKAQALEDAVSQGADLAEAAKMAGLAIQKNNDKTTPDIAAEAFYLGENEISTLIERENTDGSLGGFFMVQLESITESYIPEFADVKNEVKESFIFDKRLEKLSNAEPELEILAPLFGVEIKQARVALNSSNDYPSELSSPEFRKNPVGFTRTFATSEKYLFARLKSVSLTPPEAGQEDIGERILLRFMQNMVTQAYEDSLTKRYKVTRNEEALRSMIFGEALGG